MKNDPSCPRYECRARLAACAIHLDKARSASESANDRLYISTFQSVLQNSVRGGQELVAKKRKGLGGIGGLSLMKTRV